MIDYETSWGTLPEGLIHAESGSRSSAFRLPSNNLGITNDASVAAALGILLYRTIPGSSRPRRDAASPWGDYPTGRPLVEVFWVRIENIDGQYGWATVAYMVMNNAAEARIEIIMNNGDDENPANVYGSIVARTGAGDTNLFYKAKSDRIDIIQDAATPLERTAVAVPMDKGFSINATLYD
ncbi:hypothetical protein F4776DRAFT_664387 [Hypoxylon sp. NC0597]|nr:hypothetical protein F4776DRAFT_664387 [Hypoxylon sp. NC0597]